MIGPSLKSRGGIASVVNTYQQSGLFDKWPIVYIHTHVEGSKLKKLLVATKALAMYVGLLVRGRVQLVHVHVPRRTAFWRKSIFISLAYIIGRPVLVHMHSGGFPDFYWKECGPVRKWVVRFILDRADHIIVLSSQWWDLLHDITSNHRLVMIPNYLFLPDKAEEVPKEEGNNCNKYGSYILFLGRLNEEKGFFDLLDALVILKNKLHDAKLVCGGEGDWGIVNSRIAAKGLTSNVRLLGWVEGQEREQLIKNAMIFILPSYVEGMPMVLIEAMSQGIPVIATRVGGVPDVITTDVDGVLLGVGDVNAIAASLQELITDVDRRLTMGAAGKRTVIEKFTSEQVLPMLDELYREYRVLPKIRIT